MSSVAKRTRKQKTERFMEMYKEWKKGEGSSGSKNGEPTKSAAPTQRCNQDKENEVEENHGKGNKEVAVGPESHGNDGCNQDKEDEVEEHHAKRNKEVSVEPESHDSDGVMHADDKDRNGIDEGRESLSDKMVVVSSDDSDSDSSGSETNNSDDEDFNIDADSDKENSHLLIDTDESSSETEDADERDVLVNDKDGRDDEAGVQVIVIEDSDDEDKCINVTKKRGSSNSTYRKEEENLRSSKKFKGPCDDRKVLKVAKTRPCEEDSDREGKRDVDARSGEINENGAGSQKKIRGPKTRTVDKNRRNLVDILVDSMVHGTDAVQDEAATEPPSVKSSLPLKFRFEDEDDSEPEKSETDNEVDALFSEALYGEMVSSNHEFEDEAKTDGDTICSVEGHDTYLNEEIGLVCRCCNKVVTEIKDVPPSFGKDPKDASERRRYIGGDNSVLYKFHFGGSDDDGQGLDDYREGTVWDLIPNIRKNMYPHQREGFEFLWMNMAETIDLDKLNVNNVKPGGGCIISHAPGTGKTRLTIIFLQTFLKKFPQSHPVIIAPAGMLLTWEEEFKKWGFEFPFHNLNNPEFSGKERDDFVSLLSPNKGQNKKVNEVRLVKLCSWDKGNSVLGMSYKLYDNIAGERFVKSDGEKRKKKEKAVVSYEDTQVRKVLIERAGLVVLDEGHIPRNDKSSIWNSVLELQTERRIILSGTPFQNSLLELLNTLKLVRPSIARALGKEPLIRHCIRQKQSGDEGASDVAVERLKAAMSPFVHVHKGSILQDNLPGLRDFVVLLNPPELQRKLIEGTQALQKKELEKMGTMEFEHSEAMVSVHPCLCKEKISLIGKDKLNKLRLNYDEGVKTKFTMALIRRSLNKRDKEKVLVFSQHILVLDLVRDQLREHLGLGSNEVLLIQGEIDQKSRKILIDKFNDPKSAAKVMLASTKCCSEGISLVGASRVVLLDVAWNPSVERQAISRAYRLGQNRVVYTYHLMTSGTAEVGKYCRQAEKDRLAELVFAPTNGERRKWKRPAEISDDMLEEMRDNEHLKGMFEKIIPQPKEQNLLEWFGVLS